jgi:hypothetical protein
MVASLGALPSRRRVDGKKLHRETRRRDASAPRLEFKLQLVWLNLMKIPLPRQSFDL